MASAIICNNKALASIINYNHKCDATLWSVPYNCNNYHKDFIVQATGVDKSGITITTLHFICNLRTGPIS
jgi:hypothetical protein